MFGEGGEVFHLPSSISFPNSFFNPGTRKRMSHGGGCGDGNVNLPVSLLPEATISAGLMYKPAFVTGGGRRTGLKHPAVLHIETVVRREVAGRI